MATPQARGSAWAVSLLLVAMIVAALGFAASVSYLVAGVSQQV